MRRLLENGANASFVSRIADPAVSIDDIVADPVARLREDKNTHAGLPLPPAMLGERLNSAGLDLADAPTLAQQASELAPAAARH